MSINNTPFNFAQSFFLDPARVGNADRVNITSVDLYFKSLPSVSTATSLLYNPGVYVCICPVENNVPVLKDCNQTAIAYLRSSSIQASATSLIPTKFVLREPLQVLTNKKYAVLIAFDGNESFVLWTARAGEVNLVTGQQITLDSGYVDGQFFQITNGVQLDPLTSVDLTFKVNISKATSLSESYQVVNDAYEFLRVTPSTLSGRFYGGELVYKQASPEAGTVGVEIGSTTITGTSTSFGSLFSVGDRIVVESGSGKALRVIQNIIDNTTLSVTEPMPFSNTAAVYKKTVTGIVHNYDGINSLMILAGSTATNSTFRIAAGNTVVGVSSGATVTVNEVANYPVMLYGVDHRFVVPTSSTVKQTINFANSAYNVNPARAVTVFNNTRQLIDNYPAIIASRSNEVINTTNLHSPGSKSVIETLEFTTANPYASPSVLVRDLSFFVGEPDINNSSANEERPNGGSARSKYISKRFDLPVEQYSEDLRVFLDVYRPAGTNVEVYAKFYNPVDSDSFEEKYWTKLALVSTANSVTYSDITNKSDILGLEYTVPAYHSGTLVPGTFTTTLSSAVVQGTSGAVNTSIVAGDVVRIYNPLIPANYFITSVTASNTSTFTIAGDSINSSTVSNTSLASTGMLVEKFTDSKYSAFTDNQNNNILRYYSLSSAPISTYRTFAIKIVMLSEQTFTVPAVYDMKAVALSA